ncbi:hypothetical protein V6N13_142430 [Hibiscus sabdariffa]|uniref:Uncharacterized protein n=2 Tax=Hibiscus sabdariffa TaxID=183260 RepID=A0ABR1Z6E4_9ROSI
MHACKVYLQPACKGLVGRLGQTPSPARVGHCTRSSCTAAGSVTLHYRARSRCTVLHKAGATRNQRRVLQVCTKPTPHAISAGCCRSAQSRRHLHPTSPTPCTVACHLFLSV